MKARNTTKEPKVPPGSPIGPIIEQLKTMTRGLRSAVMPDATNASADFVDGKCEGIETAITLLQRAGALHVTAADGQPLVQVQRRAENASLESRVAKLERQMSALARVSDEQARAMPEILRAPRGGTVPKTSSRSTTSKLPRGELLVLTAIAQHAGGVTKEQITILTGYKRSTRDAYLQRLRERVLIFADEEIIVVSAGGLTALGPDFKKLPTGDSLRAYWLDRLPGGESRVLGVLTNAYPGSVSRDQISNATGFKRSTRDAYIQRLLTRKLIERDDADLIASATLFAKEKR